MEKNELEKDEKCLEKVVKSPIKVDLHIHSCFSKTRDDRQLVGEGTIENIPILVNKLNECGVNMASITDHDFFSYSMYKELKKHEGDGSIKKILPGVEFSVGIPNEEGVIKPIHVIAIFDDRDDEKLKKIESNILKLKDGKVQYDLDKDKLFSEAKLVEILKNIGLDVVLIAHQKNSVSSKSKKINDLNTLGENKLGDFLTSEIFEALEFKSLKNGLFNNVFAVEQNKKYNYDIVKFISGSDCHQWKYYPKHDEKEELQYEHTYLKCLPTFKGLSMALSDYSRIQLGDSFFSVDNKKLDKINITINDKENVIPLSPGINAIVGDNSIGKSLLLHKINHYSGLKKQVVDGYETYLETNHVLINSDIKEGNLYLFDSQGAIRKRFENNNVNNSLEFLNQKFPGDPNKELLVQKINDEFSKFFACLKNKLDFDEEYSKLCTLLMNDKDVERKTLSINKIKNNKLAMDKLTDDIGYFEKLIASIGNPHEHASLEKNDVESLAKIKSYFQSLKDKYQKKYEMEKRCYGIRNALNQGIDNYNKETNAYKNQDIRKNEEFDRMSTETADTIAKMVELSKKIKPFSFGIEKTDINPNELKYGDYRFIKRFKGVKVIDNDYLSNVLKSCLKANSEIETDTITKEKLGESIKEYDQNESAPLDFLKKKVEEKINSDFQVEPAILNKETDVFDHLSSGLNATIYFDIISGDDKPGIYIVDQPEDDVSQKSIKQNLISDFKKMSLKRQIILVTHNPQFVVNLDVDNVICIRKENEEIKISSGALEYENGEDSIIKMVADNLDGGVDAIKKRWKRYGKEIETY